MAETTIGDFVQSRIFLPALLFSIIVGASSFSFLSIQVGLLLALVTYWLLGTTGMWSQDNKKASKGSKGK